MTAPVRLDLYDIACLAGGPDRVVDTALVALVRDGPHPRALPRPARHRRPRPPASRRGRRPRRGRADRPPLGRHDPLAAARRRPAARRRATGSGGRGCSAGPVPSSSCCTATAGRWPPRAPAAGSCASCGTGRSPAGRPSWCGWLSTARRSWATGSGRRSSSGPRRRVAPAAPRATGSRGVDHSDPHLAAYRDRRECGRRRRVRHRQAHGYVADGHDAPGTSPQLDVYDIAYLAGGPDRVVDTALVALVETGRIRVHPPGQLHRRRAAPAAPGRGGGARRRGHPRAPLGRRHPVAARGRRPRARHRSPADRRRPAEPLGASSPAGRDVARPTAAGRRMLGILAADPPTDPAWDGGTAVLVALHGRDRLSDELRRSSIFEPSLCRPRRSGRKAPTANRRRPLSSRRAEPEGAAAVGGEVTALDGSTHGGHPAGVVRDDRATTGTPEGRTMTARDARRLRHRLPRRRRRPGGRHRARRARRVRPGPRARAR